MARGFAFSPVACLINFASSNETGKARSPSSGFGRRFGVELFNLDAEQFSSRASNSVFQTILELE